MKEKLKKFFLLGAGVAAAGLTLANRKKIKSIINQLVKKGEMTAKQGEELGKELLNEAKKVEKRVSEIMKKPAPKPKSRKSKKKSAKKK